MAARSVLQLMNTVACIYQWSACGVIERVWISEANEDIELPRTKIQPHPGTINVGCPRRRRLVGPVAADRSHRSGRIRPCAAHNTTVPETQQEAAYTSLHCNVEGVRVCVCVFVFLRVGGWVVRRSMNGRISSPAAAPWLESHP
ncbi:hypothetical protein B0T22DRAFT_102031 [Podospora appendiculata]|uniref:Uncharacterized protein n=1 Tax=Podospora appendiculata TaxID=314037 RepID=A0AAE1CIH8_9PEZI|nr:hypothetical protein B0T22DRAFT_102031 [Podospora appendiculata]